MASMLPLPYVFLTGKGLSLRHQLKAAPYALGQRLTFVPQGQTPSPLCSWADFDGLYVVYQDIPAAGGVVFAVEGLEDEVFDIAFLRSEFEFKGFPIFVFDEFRLEEQFGFVAEALAAPYAQFDGFVVAGVGIGVGQVEHYLVTFFLLKGG